MTTGYKRVYFDTTPLIYYLDAVQPYAQKVRSIIVNGLEQEGSFVTSIITNTEYLVLPFRENDYEKIMEFEQFKRILNMEVIMVDNLISTQAAHIRAKYKGIKGMDSLHLATAIIYGCDLFLTNDIQLKQVVEVPVVLVDDL